MYLSPFSLLCCKIGMHAVAQEISPRQSTELTQRAQVQAAVQKHVTVTTPPPTRTKVSAKTPVAAVQFVLSIPIVPKCTDSYTDVCGGNTRLDSSSCVVSSSNKKRSARRGDVEWARLVTNYSRAMGVLHHDRNVTIV